MKGTVFAVEKFYQEITGYIVDSASLGWLFADSFDRSFIEEASFNLVAKEETYLSDDDPIALKNQSSLLRLDSSQNLQKVINELSTLGKYNYLKNLIFTDDAILVNDSFRNDPCDDLGHAIEETFEGGVLNLVVIGAGVCGLFLANSLKHCFGGRANVLVLDNRSRRPNTRERFTRSWLTDIETELFKLYQPPNVQFLMKCFGRNGKIGIPINILETILQLSCKDQGVKFYFSRTLDYSRLNNNVIDLVFDATGGRLAEPVYSVSNSTEVGVNLAKTCLDLKAAGVNQLYNLPGAGLGDLKVVLKPCGNFHRPYIRDTKICTQMCKITGVPIKLLKPIMGAVKTVNSSNLFYVWEGTLKDEINEGLIIVNLLRNEYEFLTARLETPIKLKNFLISEPNISNHLNKNIIFIIEMLALLDVNTQIAIESTFNYIPYINLNASSGSLNGKRIFPVGDSLFSGHPKMGNGLSCHLPLINALMEKMVNH